jgi:hypothetical protein
LSQRQRIAALAVALPLLLTAACTIRVEGQTSATGTSSSSSAPRTKSEDKTPPTSLPPSPTDEQLPDGSGSPADTSDKSGPAQPGSGPDSGQMRVEGVRMVTQDGFDRLVIDLSTDAVPAWALRYTEATGPGGGPVDIAGDAFLRLSLQTGGDPGGRGQTSLRTSPGPIAAVLTTGAFEGTEEVLIGTRGGQAPFRAFALTDPGRIVIDVRPAG